jgi:hypothetical protein
VDQGMPDMIHFPAAGKRPLIHRSIYTLETQGEID